ncbi:hypothetical protein [Streptomyces sp. NPDC001153]
MSHHLQTRPTPLLGPLRALAEGVATCPHCRPDAELGVLSQRVSGGWAAQLSFVQRESRSSPVRWNRAPESFA